LSGKIGILPPRSILRQDADLADSPSPLDLSRFAVISPSLNFRTLRVDKDNGTVACAQ
jgi:hypothetical protein